MQTLLTALQSIISARLTYLTWVGVIDNVLLPPEGPGFPLIGLKDGDQINESIPSQKDRQILTIEIVAYQELFDVEPGASIMGLTGSLGDASKGVLAMGADVRNVLTLAALQMQLNSLQFHWLHCDRIFASQTLFQEQGSKLQFQRSIYTFRRFT